MEFTTNGEEMERNANKTIQITILVFVAALISMPLFYKQIFGVDGSALGSFTDFSVHISFVKDFSGTGALPSYPLYHLIIFALSFGSVDFVYLSMISIIVLTGFIVTKAILTYLIINNEAHNGLKSSIVSVALLIVSPIINWWSKNIYLGQITPNVWHNPTTILAMPLAIALYFYTYKNIKSSENKKLIMIVLLIIANAICKPNYLIAYIPVVFVYITFLAINDKDFRVFKKALIISIVAAAMLLLQFALTYGGDSKSSIIIDPFGVWGNYSPYIVRSLLLSIAYPALYTILNLRTLSSSTKLSWGIFLVALLQFSLLAEMGDRYFDGNWSWGSYISLYILFVSVTKDFLKQKFSWKSIPVLLVLLAHLASGVLYLNKILTGRGYF
jgi:hypothetical protein